MDLYIFIIVVCFAAIQSLIQIQLTTIERRFNSAIRIMRENESRIKQECMKENNEEITEQKNESQINQT